MGTVPPPGVLIIVKDASQEAESALAQLREVAELMRGEEYIQALGAFEGP